jgi:formylglycine-generating enzyme required for sulfatase activity
MKTISLSLITLSLLSLLSACNGVGTAKFGEAAIGTGNAIDTSLAFSGIISVADKTDSSITINWTAHADAVAYDIYDSSTYITTILNQSSNQANLTGLTPSRTYRFLVRMKAASGKNDGNTTDLVTVMNSAPNVPLAIALQSPTSSPSLVATPTIRVSGVKNGDTIKLFTNPTCTTEVASAAATGATIDLTTSSLAVGSYNFYAKAIGIASNASTCSTATVAYIRNLCPSNYISVPHNTLLGTTADFCVAKYEMKCVGTSCPSVTPGANAVATSTASDTPWVSISQTDSRTACTNLNAINGVTSKYALISNSEWMTVAQNVELVNANWSSGTAGTGVLARGHNDNSPASALAAAADNDPYSGTGNNSGQAANSGWEQARTLTLNNGGVIWDLPGNVWEWVDWNVTPAEKAYQSGAGNDLSVDRGWKEWTVIDTKIGGGDEMKPETWESNFFPGLNSLNGLGGYYAGLNNYGGAALRGGDWLDTTGAGAFALLLYHPESFALSRVGFRCVYRP